MRLGRIIPPAASPIDLRDILNGFRGLVRGRAEIERFRGEVKQYFGVKSCFFVSSGKAALTLILEAGRLLAIVSAHMFGVPSDVERIRDTVHDQSVTIIEDAAQVMGAEANGRKLGTLGDVGFFSLGRGKAISAVEGGIILSNREDIGRGIRA
jgi:perosamine synthetase